MALLELTSKGLYCKEGDFYIDPQSKVKTAIITHAHRDHARKGSENYICSQPLEHILRHRLGTKPTISTISYRKQHDFGKVKVSLHPAGHMLGSSQIRVEHHGEVWVVSGDYKREKDPTCEDFEPVKCDVFITEATFALPQYEWKSSKEIIEDILTWHKENKKNNRSSILLCYSLGKAQRILGELALYTKEKVYIHETIAPYVQYYKDQGIKLAETEIISGDLKRGSLAIYPPNSKYLLDTAETAYISGWAMNSNTDKKGFALSDHADWPALIKTIEETRAKKVLVTHGFTKALIQYLRTIDIEAYPLESHILKRKEKGQLSLKRFLSQ
jgi:putative mRNA 3-end processing factor